MPKKVLTVVGIGAAVSAAAYFFKRSLLKWAVVGTVAAGAFVWYKARG